MDEFVKKYTSKEEKSFLKVDRSPWDAASSGQDKRWSDDTGHLRGANHDDSDSHGLRQKLPYERTNSPNERFADLVDSSEGMGSGNALTGGGGPLSQGYGIGSGKRRYPAKRPGPQSNASDDF
jgi:hypothetical protein